MLTQSIAKLNIEDAAVKKQKEINDNALEWTHSYTGLPSNSLSEGIMLLVDTAMLRRICGKATNLGDVWTRLTQALARTPYSMRTKPATEKQKMMLSARFDFDSDDLEMLNPTDVSALIGALLDFEQPTIIQICWLRYRGVPDASMPTTKSSASQMISDLSARGAFYV